eukprot:scaffold128709_cov18-Tisochrysis_lutea.AAC.1
MELLSFYLAKVGCIPSWTVVYWHLTWHASDAAFPQPGFGVSSIRKVMRVVCQARGVFHQRQTNGAL